MPSSRAGTVQRRLLTVSSLLGMALPKAMSAGEMDTWPMSGWCGNTKARSCSLDLGQLSRAI